MRSSADTLLIHGAVERYAGRLTEAVVNVLAHPSTELHLGLYKRGSWMFRREDGVVAAVRQVPYGKADDIRLRYPTAEQWIPSATETPA